MVCSPKKSSQKRYLIKQKGKKHVDIYLTRKATTLVLQIRHGIQIENIVEYSEEAVSMSSLCKLLKRTSYGYLFELASAICGINGGSSIS